MCSVTLLKLFLCSIWVLFIFSKSPLVQHMTGYRNFELHENNAKVPNMLVPVTLFPARAAIHEGDDGDHKLEPFRSNILMEELWSRKSRGCYFDAPHPPQACSTEARLCKPEDLKAPLPTSFCLFWSIHCMKSTRADTQQSWAFS